MYSISNIPNGAEIPPVGTLLKGRPTSWQGLPIKWSSSADPVPVYLTSFPKSSEPTTAKVFLFGARYDLAEALLDDESLGKGHFIEYFVMWRRPDGGWNLHRLLQHHSVTFSDGSDDDTKDYVPARTISSPSRLALDRLPDWESEGDAVWPTNHTVAPNV
jgi:hypothetical protein